MSRGQNIVFDSVRFGSDRCPIEDRRGIVIIDDEIFKVAVQPSRRNKSKVASLLSCDYLDTINMQQQLQPASYTIRSGITYTATTGRLYSLGIEII